MSQRPGVVPKSRRQQSDELMLTRMRQTKGILSDSRIIKDDPMFHRRAVAARGNQRGIVTA
jgi:hypothetical protein